MSPIPDAAIGRLRRQLATPSLVGGRYRIGAELGRGGMGEVHRARDEVMGREVAIKLLAVDVPLDRFEDHLRREFALLARLEHPGIVPIYDAGVLEDGRPYYVMRLVEGQRLDAFARSPVSRGELLRVVLRVLDAVAFAHGQGVVHCDLKPANVMVGIYGEVFVLDWGIARMVATLGEGRPPVADEGHVVGTPGYMAPEQRMGSSVVDGRADVHAIGIMLGELNEVHADPSPRPLRSIVAKATEQVPERRYAGAAEFAADLRRLLDGEKVLAHREGLAERMGRIWRRHQTAILLLLAYVVVRTVILLWRGI